MSSHTYIHTHRAEVVGIVVGVVGGLFLLMTIIVTMGLGYICYKNNVTHQKVIDSVSGYSIHVVLSFNCTQQHKENAIQLPSAQVHEMYKHVYAHTHTHTHTNTHAHKDTNTHTQGEASIQVFCFW